eukprot:TRINITY_DN27421_c0_g1_i1.p3 TRINITY_DN27421_c0_g1~~TRINITY_DN27421_c0_g1_i1.p3  ORF type:complete len:124 (+),score=12.73 TRINITY_DN27421_c0_g1_i1:341-712(+)
MDSIGIPARGNTFRQTRRTADARGGSTALVEKMLPQPRAVLVDVPQEAQVSQQVRRQMVSARTVMNHLGRTGKSTNLRTMSHLSQNSRKMIRQMKAMKIGSSCENASDCHLNWIRCCAATDGR